LEKTSLLDSVFCGQNAKYTLSGVFTSFPGNFRMQQSDTFSGRPLLVHPHRRSCLDVLDNYVKSDVNIAYGRAQAETRSSVDENFSLTEQTGSIDQNRIPTIR
jgi:hypothetical protein